MPNPLVGRQAVTSKTDVERPIALVPVEEHYAGDNNAYRGTESHGVESPNHDESDADERLVEYESPEPEPEPIPVRIVQGEHSRERRRFATDKVDVPAQSSKLVATSRLNRFRLVLRNTHDTIVVYFGPDPSVREYVGGFPLEGNDSQSLSTEDAIYVYNPDLAATVTIGVISEYTVEE